MNAPTKSPYVVFLRKDSPYYWVRFSIPGQGQKRIGLKTDDPVEAAKLAEQQYQRAVWSAEEGLLHGKTSFDKLAREYVASAEKAAKAAPKQHSKAVADRAVLDRYMIPFFGKSTITSINVPKLNQYMDWRRTYWTEGPGKDLLVIDYERNGKKLYRPARHIEATQSTLRREAVTLRAVFKHAVRQGHIKDSDIPKLDMKAQQPNKRPSFTDAEIDKLLKLAEKRIAEASANGKRNAKLPPHLWQEEPEFEHRIKYERLVLYSFINIALATGMRPTELHNLDWGHIVGFKEERKKPIAKQRIRIAAYGKGRKPQELVPNIGAFSNFINLWDAFVTMHEREPRMDEPVFVNASGERAKSFKKSLNALLDAAKLKTDAFGRARSAYSFRHTYATRQLRKGTDVYTLAINMRTSVKMIEMYYSDVVPDDVAKRLEGSWD